METRSANIKRRTRSGGRTSEWPAERKRPSKRRRKHPNADTVPDKKRSGPQPMDIDTPGEPPAGGKAPREVGTRHTATAPVKSATGENATAALPAASPNRYVPMAPPTVQQVADLLFRSKKTVKSKTVVDENAIPRPPPPTPFVVSPLPEPPKPTHHPPEQHETPRKPPLGRRLLKRVVPLFCLVLLVEVSCGFVLGTPLHEALYDAWLILPSRQTVKNIIPAFVKTHLRACRINPHIILPLHVDGTEPRDMIVSNITLREFLLDEEGFHLAMAPAFFGIYAYVGAFTAWDEHMTDMEHIKSVAGASAGAMAAVMLAARIPPQAAADLGNSMTLEKFADPLGIGAVFKGDKFEAIMQEFFEVQSPNSTGLLEDAEIPVAVTAFDLKALQGRILSRGSMARAARASSTFPFLFQPVSHEGGLLIDGGITDILGLKGLAAFEPDTPKRIVNMAVGGGFYTAPHGPKDMPEGVIAKEILSLSVINTPQCGPWAMKNGPRATAAARRAMLASMDLPLYYGTQEGHYELHIDARSFVE